MSERKAIRQNYGGRWVQDLAEFFQENCCGDGLTITDIEQKGFISLGILPMKMDDLLSQMMRAKIMIKRGDKYIWMMGKIKIKEKSDNSLEELESERPEYKGK